MAQSSELLTHRQVLDIMPRLPERVQEVLWVLLGIGAPIRTCTIEGICMACAAHTGCAEAAEACAKAMQSSIGLPTGWTFEDAVERFSTALNPLFA